MTPLLTYNIEVFNLRHLIKIYCDHNWTCDLVMRNHLVSVISDNIESTAIYPNPSNNC